MTKKQKTIPRLLDGKYFKIEKSDDSKVEASCTTCGKIRKGDIKSTGNFMEHYRSLHPSMVNEIDCYRKQKQSDLVTNLKQTTLTRPISPKVSTEVVSDKKQTIKKKFEFNHEITFYSQTALLCFFELYC